ncbi:hypothetical protein [Nostoc sp. FACHB-110]|uniref:hypothetical protein n=1 Tax=Nostoc sp. FACHB-110 TaxID=2692834 RepID=UPI00168353FA|nr:hypothetical protein [Nostoc sp. FACHB-110]MBD2435819.1 hypothetical protein [Nostoc sp. FACHB-110]
MKFDANVASFILGSVCAASGWVVWWVNQIQTDKQNSTQKAAEAAKKEYAAQRDFEHLKNNQLQISAAIATGFDEIEDRFNILHREMTEIKAYFIRSHTTDK